MKTQTEALKMALEALEKLTGAAEGFSVSGVYFNEELQNRKCLDDAYDAMGFAQEALAQQEGQSNYCLQCEALGRELAALKAQQSNEQVKPRAYLVYAKGSHRYFTLTFDIEKVPEIYKGGDVEPLYTHPPVPTAQPKESNKDSEHLEPVSAISDEVIFDVLGSTDYNPKHHKIPLTRYQIIEFAQKMYEVGLTARSSRKGKKK